MNKFLFFKIFIILGLVFFLLGVILFLFTPSRKELVSQLEKQNLPTPIFASREQLFEILNNFSKINAKD